MQWINYYNVVIILNKIQHTCILIGQMIHSLNDFALSPTNFNATIIRNVLPNKENSALYLTLDGQSNAVSGF